MLSFLYVHKIQSRVLFTQVEAQFQCQCQFTSVDSIGIISLKSTTFSNSVISDRRATKPDPTCATMALLLPRYSVVHLPIYITSLYSKLLQLLGGGQFGQVFFGELRKTRVTDASAASDTIDVAIKAPRDGRNVNHQKALADELKVMIAIGTHPNVLCLIGAVTKQMSTSVYRYIIFLASDRSCP